MAVLSGSKKNPVQRNGDELHAKIQKAEREIEGLKNTLDLVNSGNDRLRRGNKAVGAQDDDRATYAEFEKRYLKSIGHFYQITATFNRNYLCFSHRSHFETLQYKQRVKKDLEEDLHLLSDGLNEAEGHRERTMAELELQESNRLQLQKVSHSKFH